MNTTDCCKFNIFNETSVIYKNTNITLENREMFKNILQILSLKVFKYSDGYRPLKDIQRHELGKRTVV